MKRINYIIILLVFGLLAKYSVARENIIKKTQKSARTVTAGCLPASSETNLDLNNVRALILANGGLWQGDAAGEYEIPKGSRKTSMFAGSIWIGGVDINGQLRTCARTYRGAANGNDFWPGPLISTGEGIASVSPEVCVLYDKHFKITKEEVETFVAFNEADAETKADVFSDYTVPKVIQEWQDLGYVINDHVRDSVYTVNLSKNNQLFTLKLDATTFKFLQATKIVPKPLVAEQVPITLTSLRESLK